MKKNKKQNQTNVERFNKWMKKKVKSIYYSNNSMMIEAYKKID